MTTPTPTSAPRPVVTGHRTRAIALYLIAIIVVAATATAFVQSYDGLYQWAQRYLSDGWARTWPLQVDAWIAVGELALYIAYRDHWPKRRTIWPWLAAVTGLAVSTVFNVGHLAAADLAGHVTAAVPPIAAFAGLFLGLQVLKYVEQHDTATHPYDTDRTPPTGREPGDHAAAASEQQPARQRTKRREILLDAERLLAADPDLTGHELGHQLNVSERTGRRLRQRFTGSAPLPADRPHGHDTSVNGHRPQQV